MSVGPLFFAVMNPSSDEQTALARAVRLARGSGGRVMAFLCVYRSVADMGDAASAKEGKVQVLAEARAWLQRQLDPYKDSGVAIEQQVYWNHSWYNSVVFAASRYGADMVIKNATIDESTRRRLFGNSDFTLMRQAAPPVLLARADDEGTEGPIVACVDLENTDSDQQYLSNLVMKHANELARWLDQRLYLLTVRRSPGGLEPLRAECDEDFATLEEVISDRYGVPAERIRVLERTESISGTLLAEIDRLAPQLVVMGTLARKGIMTALLGNTTQKVLDQLHFDVVTVG